MSLNDWGRKWGDICIPKTSFEHWLQINSIVLIFRECNFKTILWRFALFYNSELCLRYGNEGIQ